MLVGVEVDIEESLMVKQIFFSYNVRCFWRWWNIDITVWNKCMIMAVCIRHLPCARNRAQNQIFSFNFFQGLKALKYSFPPWIHFCCFCLSENFLYLNVHGPGTKLFITFPSSFDVCRISSYVYCHSRCRSFVSFLLISFADEETEVPGDNRITWAIVSGLRSWNPNHIWFSPRPPRHQALYDYL